MDPSDCNNEGCGGNPSNVNPIISITFIARLFNALLDMDAALKKGDAQRAARWKDIATHIAQPQIAVSAKTGQRVWAFSEVAPPSVPDVPQTNPNPINLYPVFPSEQVSLSSPPALLQVARDTIAHDASWGRDNAFVEVFPAAARMNATGWVDQFVKQLGARMTPNGVVSEGGGGMEVVGATEAVNSALLSSHEAFVRLFPSWQQDAAFTRLRTKGAFLVNASLVGGEVQSPIEVESDVGGNATFLFPWGEGIGGVVVTDAQGRAVPVHWQVPTRNKLRVFSFETHTGASYRIERNRDAADLAVAVDSGSGPSRK